MDYPVGRKEPKSDHAKSFDFYHWDVYRPSWRFWISQHSREWRFHKKTKRERSVEIENFVTKPFFQWKQPQFLVVIIFLQFTRNFWLIWKDLTQIFRNKY